MLVHDASRHFFFFHSETMLETKHRRCSHCICARKSCFEHTREKKKNFILSFFLLCFAACSCTAQGPGHTIMMMYSRRGVQRMNVNVPGSIIYAVYGSVWMCANAEHTHTHTHVAAPPECGVWNETRWKREESTK